MQLVDADFITPDEQAMLQVLQAHPQLKHRLTLLLNSYRELVQMCLQGEADPADIVRSLAKDEQAMRRLGIPLLETHEDWMRERQQVG